jgi:hypothetical protein
MSEAPYISKELVEWLQRVFSSELPRGEEVPHREQVARLMGQQDVTRKLIHLHNIQTSL